MLKKRVNTCVIGAGQAGIAISEHLSHQNTEHILLERSRIAERWRSERWDSLVMNGPAWHDRFPSLTFDSNPNGFPGKEEVADYFERYAKHIKAPIHTGVNVLRVTRPKGQSFFDILTSEGQVQARNVVAATGAFQNPVIPRLIPDIPGVQQLHSNGYKNPQQLADGAVLVIGAGSSGSQIADELNRLGKTVYLSMGPHDRPPRSYRGRDFVWWLGVLGKWDAAKATPGKEHVTIAVSGARGGATIDFRRFANEGITLLGMTQSFSNNVLTFADDLITNLTNGDKNYLSVLDEADAYVTRHGLDLPEEPSAREFPSDAHCITHPIQSLDVADAHITSIIWATGYRSDYSWLELDAFDERGAPVHQRGVTEEPGFYFLGLPWQSRRGSSFIWGVWHDAKYVADQIGIQNHYHAYHSAESAANTQS